MRNARDNFALVVLFALLSACGSDTSGALGGSGVGGPVVLWHTSIWGGEQSFLVAEMSDGIEIVDVAGYDASGGNAGFMLFHTFHEDSCRFDTECAKVHYP